MSLVLREQPALQQQCMMVAYEHAIQDGLGVNSAWTTLLRHQIGLLFLSFDVTGAFRFGLELMATEVGSTWYEELLVHHKMPVLDGCSSKMYVDVARRNDGVFIPVSDPYMIQVHGGKTVKTGSMQIEYLNQNRSAWSPMSLDEVAESGIDETRICWGESSFRERITSHIVRLQNISEVINCCLAREFAPVPQLRKLCNVETEALPILIEIIDSGCAEMREVISELINSSLSKLTANAKKGNESRREAVNWFVSQIEIISRVLAADPAMLNHHFGDMTQDMRCALFGSELSDEQDNSRRAIAQVSSRLHLVVRTSDSGAWQPGAIFYVLPKITSQPELKRLYALLKRYQKEIVVGGAFAAVVAIGNLSINTVKWLVDHIFEQKLFYAQDWVAYLNNTVLSTEKLPAALIQFLKVSSAESFAVLIKNVSDTVVISLLAKHYFTDPATGTVDVKCRSLNNVLKNIEGLRVQHLLREMLKLKCYSLSCIMQQLSASNPDQAVADYVYEQVAKEVLGKFSSADNEAVIEQKYRKFFRGLSVGDTKELLIKVRHLFHNYNHPQLTLPLPGLQPVLHESITPISNFFERVAVGVHYAKGDRVHYAEADKLERCCNDLATANHYYPHLWRYKLLQLFTKLNEQAGGSLTTNDDDKLSLARRVYLALQEIDKLITQQAIVLYPVPKPGTMAAPQSAASSSGSSQSAQHAPDDDGNLLLNY